MAPGGLGCTTGYYKGAASQVVFFHFSGQVHLQATSAFEKWLGLSEHVPCCFQALHPSSCTTGPATPASSKTKQTSPQWTPASKTATVLAGVFPFPSILAISCLMVGPSQNVQKCSAWLEFLQSQLVQLGSWECKLRMSHLSGKRMKNYRDRHRSQEQDLVNLVVPTCLWHPLAVWLLYVKFDFARDSTYCHFFPHLFAAEGLEWMTVLLGSLQAMPFVYRRLRMRKTYSNIATLAACASRSKR